MNLWADPGRLSALALLSGWAAVDTTEALQLMVCQPLPAGFLAGCLVGEPTLGLFVGGALQLLWSRLAPVGAAAFPDAGPATVAGVAAGASVLPTDARWAAAGGFLPGPDHVAAVLVAAFMALLAAMMNQWIVLAHRTANRHLALRAERAAAAGSFTGVEVANALGIPGAFARGVLTVPLVLGVTAVVFHLVTSVGSGVRISSSLVGPLSGIPNIGPALLWAFGLTALAATLVRARRMDWLLLAGGMVAGLLLGGIRP